MSRSSSLIFFLILPSLSALASATRRHTSLWSWQLVPDSESCAFTFRWGVQQDIGRTHKPIHHFTTNWHAMIWAWVASNFSVQSSRKNFDIAPALIGRTPEMRLYSRFKVLGCHGHDSLLNTALRLDAPFVEDFFSHPHRVSAHRNPCVESGM